MVYHKNKILSQNLVFEGLISKESLSVPWLNRLGNTVTIFMKLVVECRLVSPIIYTSFPHRVTFYLHSKQATRFFPLLELVQHLLRLETLPNISIKVLLQQALTIMVVLLYISWALGMPLCIALSFQICASFSGY